jgi:hypothetical protein
MQLRSEGSYFFLVYSFFKVFPEKSIDIQRVKKPSVIEPEGPVPLSQEPAIEICSESV